MTPLSWILIGLSALGAIGTVATIGANVAEPDPGDGNGVDGDGSGGPIVSQSYEVAALQLLQAVAVGSEPGCGASAAEAVLYLQRYADERAQGKKANGWLRKLGRAADRVSSCVSGQDLRRFGFRDALSFVRGVVDAAADAYVVSAGGTVTRDERARK